MSHQRLFTQHFKQGGILISWIFNFNKEIEQSDKISKLDLICSTEKIML